MADLRRPALRLALALVLGAALLIEVHTLVRSLGGHQRQQARAVEHLRRSLQDARPDITERLSRPGEAGREAAAAELRARLPGATVELFDAASGRPSLRRGPAVRVSHWADADTLRASGPLGVFVVGPFPEEPPLLLGYALFEPLVLRVALPVQELQADLEERRELLLAHAASLALVLGVALVALLGPRSTASADDPARGALVAYEAAMGHLREREQRLSVEHAAERLRLEQAVREKEALARAGELTSGMAHEVRNGLGTILGYARLIERGGDAPAVAAAAAAIREECDTLAVVVRRFVEYVRAEELKLEPFDLRASLARVVAREARAREGASVTLVPGAALELVGDEELLERAFENLVRNAREAMHGQKDTEDLRWALNLGVDFIALSFVRNARDAAGPQGSVEVALRADPAWVEVSVADDGPGLGPEGPERLRPFRSTKPGGLGLGLPLSSKLVRLHGGELRFGERAPRGLEVVLRLPRVVTERNADRADGPPPGAGAAM